MTDSYFETERFRALLDEYEECERQGKPCIVSSDEYADFAEYYQEKGMEEKALHAVQQALDLYPGAVGPLVFAARYALTRESDVEKAAAYAEQIEDKSDLEYLYIMGEILLFKGQVVDADTYFEEEADSVSDDDLDDYYLDVATIFADYDCIEEAERWFDRCEETDSPDYLELYGRILFGKGFFDEGEKVMNHLLDGNPYNSNYWNILATAHFQHGNIEEAIDSSEYSIAINPNDDEALLTKAHSLFVLGNYEQAMVFYERFNKLRSSAESHLQVAHCLMALERYEEGIDHLREAEKKAQNNPSLLLEIYQEIAYMLVYLGQLDQAINYMEKTETLDCDHEEMLVVKGHLYLTSGYLSKAQQCFERAIVETNNQGKIFLRVASSVYDNGYKELAYRMLRLLKDADIQDNSAGYSYFVLCFYHDKDKHYFMKFLRKLTEENPTEARAMLFEIFPDDLTPDEYCDYAEEHIVGDWK